MDLLGACPPTERFGLFGESSSSSLSVRLEVARLADLAERWRLSGIEALRRMSYRSMAERYNGFGPEWFPERLRNALDALHPEFRPCVLVHDVQWTLADGTVADFDRSNLEFRDNCRKAAKLLHPWWSPWRYLRISEAEAFYHLLQAFGMSAYDEACATWGRRQVP